MQSSQQISVFLDGDAATIRLGQDLAAALKAGDVVTLNGDLGAGKSTLARAVIRALAANRELEVPSPTFTLVQSYATTPPVHHYDLYRLGDQEEILELGFDEASQNGICLVEWPQMAAFYMPESRISISLSETENNGRLALIEASENKLSLISRSLAQRIFLNESGWGSADREYFSGDASARRYEKVFLDTDNAILVDSPAVKPGPAIEGGKSYAETAHIALTASAFVAVAALLGDGGFRVPAIYSCDLDNGFLLLEDLGSEGVLDDDGLPIIERYLAGAEMLAKMHAQGLPRSRGQYEAPAFDHQAMLAELDLLLDWYVLEKTGRPAEKSMRDSYHALWGEALAGLDEDARTIMLRDFHSPNILWQGGAEGTARVGLIDFQDALWGPAAYDLASLGFDARVTITPDMEQAVFSRYVETRQAVDENFDLEDFRYTYALMAAQRNSKILGIFVRLNRRDGKPAYMRHLPRISAYLERALQHPKLRRLREFYLVNNLIDSPR